MGLQGPITVCPSCTRGGLLGLWRPQAQAARVGGWTRTAIGGSRSCGWKAGWRSGTKRGAEIVQASTGDGKSDSGCSNSAAKSSKGQEDGGDEGASSAKERVHIEVAPAVMRLLEKAEKKKAAADPSGGLSLIEKNLKKRKGLVGKEGGDSKLPDIIPLSFDADARMDEKRYDGAFYSRVDEGEDEETLEINTLDDFYPAFVILLTDALLELGDLMKMFGDGSFFSIQALSRASRMPGQKRTSSLKGFPEDTQLRNSLENILVYVQALSFYISSLFTGPDGHILNADESVDTEADLLYNMYYKYKHRETLTAPLDENELLEQVLSTSSFATTGMAVRCRQGLIYPGKFMNSPALVRQEMQKALDEKFEGLVAVLVDGAPGGERGCLIAHRNELISFALPERGDVILSSSLLFGVLIGCLQYADADVGFDEVYIWQKVVVALGFLGVGASGWLARKAVATLYKVSHMVRLPFSLPVPHQGAFGTVVFYKGCLPNRTCLMDLSISSTFTSLAVSFSLIWASFSPWWSVPIATADFRGLLLVPDQMFAYSSAFTWLLHKFSVVTLSGEIGDLNLVVSPLALAGILGLHLTAMGLLPLGIMDGGRIVTGIFGRDVQHVLTGSTYVGVAVVLLATCPWLGVAWMIGATPAVLDDWFQIDEVTQPSLIRKAVGLAMVAAGVASFFPVLP